MKQSIIKSTNEFDDFLKAKLHKLHVWAKLPIVLGILTSLLYLYLFNWHDYFKNFLEWIIGATMVIIVVEFFTRTKEVESV